MWKYGGNTGYGNRLLVLVKTLDSWFLISSSKQDPDIVKQLLGEKLEQTTRTRTDTYFASAVQSDKLWTSTMYETASTTTVVTELQFHFLHHSALTFYLNFQLKK